MSHLNVEDDTMIFCWVCGVLTLGTGMMSCLRDWGTYMHLTGRLNGCVRWKMRVISPCFRCSDWILSGPNTLFKAGELMASSTFNVAMSANRELSCQMMCLCLVVVEEDLHAPSLEGVPSFSKKSAHWLIVYAVTLIFSTFKPQLVCVSWLSFWGDRRVFMECMFNFWKSQISVSKQLSAIAL